MVNNNMFSGGFGAGLGTGWNSTGVKAPTKEEKFPGLNAQQIANIEKYTANLTGTAKREEEQKIYKAMIQQIQADNYRDGREAVINQKVLNCLNNTDTKDRNFQESCNRQSELVNKIIDKRNLKYNTPEDEAMRMFMEEMDYKGIDISLLDAYLDHGDETILYESGLEEKKSGKGKKIAAGVGIGAGVVAGADVTAYAGGKTAERAGKKIYEFPIDPSVQESRQIQRAGANIKDAEIAVKDAKSELTAAKKAGEGVEEAEQALETAKNELEAAKGRSVTKVSDTAREYNIGGGVTEGWTAESRGIQARSEANQIFKKTIEPALEKSTAKINVQEIINSLEDDIVQLAKNDPDKLAAYGEALDSLKDSYKAKEFAEYPLKDSQTLKSGWQGRTPAKFWKGKEVTNELQELKGVASSKLAKAVQNELTKEIGENAGKLYGDYARLTEYADDMAKQATNAGMKGGFGDFRSSAFHKATDGASAKLGLLLNKTGKGVAKVTGVEKAANGIGDAWNYLVKNGKKFLKAAKGKGFRVEDPVGVVELLRLAPGTIGDVATEIGESNPAIVVDDLLFEIQDFKDSWNKMSDEERIENIKEQYKQATGNELEDKAAQDTYAERKKKHPNGKYGLFDPVNDVDIVMSV